MHERLSASLTSGDALWEATDLRAIPLLHPVKRTVATLHNA